MSVTGEKPPVIAVVLNAPGQPEGTSQHYIDMSQVASPEAMGALLFDLKMQAMQAMVQFGMADAQSALVRMLDGEAARMDETMQVPTRAAPIF